MQTVFSQATLSEAVSSCAALNMTLLALPDLHMLPQYFNLLQSKTRKYNLRACMLRHIFHIAESISGSAWTSGSSEGDGCDVERKFAWCPAGKNHGRGGHGGCSLVGRVARRKRNHAALPPNQLGRRRRECHPRTR
jgi:hypothetical protein